MNKELRNRVIILTEQYIKCKREKEEIEKKYKEYKSQNMNIIFDEEKEILQKKFDSINELYSNRESEHKIEIEDLSKTIKTLVNNNIQYKQKIVNLENEKKELNEENEKIKEENEKLQNENEELKIILDNLREDNERLDDERRSLISKLNFNKNQKISNFFDENDFDNYIHAVYLIDESEVNEDIQILNYERNDDESDNSISSEENLQKQFIEESCLMFLNNKRVTFRFIFNFYKPGKFTFKLVFKKNLTDGSYLFSNCSNLIHIDFSHFNTHKIVDMSNMFEGCVNLKSLDLSNFNTTKVEDMSQMFCGCEQLKYINLSSFKTFKVRSTFQMFYYVPDDCKIITRNKGLLKEKNKIYDDDDSIY